jgi:hypothetical protein
MGTMGMGGSVSINATFSAEQSVSKLELIRCNWINVNGLCSSVSVYTELSVLLTALDMASGGRDIGEVHDWTANVWTGANGFSGTPDDLNR